MVNARDLLTRPALWVPLAGALALGLAGGAVVTAFEPSLYRAETSLVVQRGGQPLAGGAKTADTVRTMRDLARSDVVATNVIRNLGLHRSPSALLGRVAVDTDAAVLRVHVDDGSKTHAKQIAQELALVFTQLVRARFGASGLSVSVFDPPHALDGRVSPQPVRNLAWGALVGLLVGSAATAAAAVRTAPVHS